MSSTIVEFLKKARAGKSVEQIARELDIPLSRARLLASTLAGSGLIKPLRDADTSSTCGDCSVCPLRHFCGFTPLRRAEQS